MSDITITVPCPNEDCEESLEVACEFQGAEPDVGLMNGGPAPSDDVPIDCKACGTTFTAEQIAVLRKAVEQGCDDWRPDDDDPAYDADDFAVHERDWL